MKQAQIWGLTVLAVPGCRELPSRSDDFSFHIQAAGTPWLGTFARSAISPTVARKVLSLVSAISHQPVRQVCIR